MPVVVPLAMVSNAFDVVWSGLWQVIKQSSLSLFFNINRTYNIILGQYGMFCGRSELEDERHWAVRLVFGALTLPVVAPIVIATNVLDLMVTGIKQFFKQSFLSINYNLARLFNIVLGDLGLFGERRQYGDKRHWMVKGLFGALTLPVVAPLALLTNSLDLVGAYFKHWRNTIVKPAILITGVIAFTTLAIPTFVLRKTLKGVYNCLVQPFVDCAQGRMPSVGKFFKNGLAVATLGTSSLVLKMVKSCFGYNNRFGRDYREVPKNDDEETLLTTPYVEAQRRFRAAIDLAKGGKFPGVTDTMRFCRPVIRLFYGFRHKAEEILKAIHDEYQIYASKNLKKEKDTSLLSINSFFASNRFTRVNAKIEKDLRPGEEKVLEAVKKYLRPGLAS